MLQVDAQLPLNEGGEVKGDVGFKKAKATLVPAFASAVTAYAVEVPPGTTHVNVMASSFSRATVKVNGMPGNMACVDVRGGGKIAITLEENGAVVGGYELTPTAVEGHHHTETIMHEKAPVAGSEAAAHVHTHGGVACTADHGEAAAAAEPAHGHSHDGGKTACTEDHSSHGHGHGDKAKAAEPASHSHDGGKTDCDGTTAACKAAGDHGHGHGAKVAEPESHGHAHAAPAAGG